LWKFVASDEDGHSEVKMEGDGMLEVGLEEDMRPAESLRTRNAFWRRGMAERNLVMRQMKMGVQSAQLRNQFLNIVRVPIRVSTESIICVARPRTLDAISGGWCTPFQILTKQAFLKPIISYHRAISG
jgi:hypothetical protein